MQRMVYFSKETPNNNLKEHFTPQKSFVEYSYLTAIEEQNIQHQSMFHVVH